MIKQHTFYKVVAETSAYDLVSCIVPPPYRLTYCLEHETRPKIPGSKIFGFVSLNHAKNWMRHMYDTSADNWFVVRGVGFNVQHQFSVPVCFSKIIDFWSGEMGMMMSCIPEGAIMCNSFIPKEILRGERWRTEY